jgi:hypothetical protein
VSPIFTTLFIAASLMSLFVAGYRCGCGMLAGAKVFATLQTPSSLWQAWQSTLIKRASLWSCLLLISVSLIKIRHSISFSTLDLLALTSLSISLGFIIPLFLNRYFNTMLNSLIIATIIGLISLREILQTSDSENVLWLKGSLCLAWPIIAFSLYYHWKKAPLSKGISFHQEIKNLNIVQVIKHFYLSFYSLNIRKPSSKSGTLPSIDWGIKILGLICVFILARGMTIAWGQGVSLPHCLAFILFAIVSSTHLMGRNLHWRHLLRPGSLREGSIATHLLKSSVIYHLIWIGVVLMIVIIFNMLFAREFTLPTFSSLVAGVTLAIELLAAYCIGILIRGCRNPSRIIFYLFLSSLLFAALIGMAFFVQNRNPMSAGLFELGFAYLFGVICLGLAALGFANKLWTRKHLLAHL